jgi:hypothetical protein
MPEMCRKQYYRLCSDLLDEHDKWFHRLKLDQGPEKWPSPSLPPLPSPKSHLCPQSRPHPSSGWVWVAWRTPAQIFPPRSRSLSRQIPRPCSPTAPCSWHLAPAESRRCEPLLPLEPEGGTHCSADAQWCRGQVFRQTIWGLSLGSACIVRRSHLDVCPTFADEPRMGRSPIALRPSPSLARKSAVQVEVTVSFGVAPAPS